MISLRYLNEAMRFDRSKTVSVPILNYIRYNLKALTPAVWKLWRW